MKLVVKTLKGTRFEIEAESQQTVADIKQIIETGQGADVYPASRQMLIHQGKVLTDDTTLEENQVSEQSFLVIMLNKNTDSSPSGGSSAQQGAAAAATSHQAPAPPSPVVAQEAAAVPNLVADNISEATVQQIQEMGAGTWDRDTVVRALRAASNNPNRAIEYLYSGIPEQAAHVRAQTVQQESNGQAPNATPLNLFPQGLPRMASNANALINADAAEDGTDLDNMDLNNPQLQSLVNMLQGNPQMLQALQNPDLMQLLQGNGDNLSGMMNELEGGEEVLEVNLTDEEMQAIERLEAMGFERDLVLEVYFACNKNEEQAANYLLDHMDEF